MKKIKVLFEDICVNEFKITNSENIFYEIRLYCICNFMHNVGLFEQDFVNLHWEDGCVIYSNPPKNQKHKISFKVI